MPLHLDRMMYLVISELASCEGPIILEVELSRTTLVQVAKDIRDGQYDKVLAVIEMNPAEGICREATHDFEAVINRAAD